LSKKQAQKQPQSIEKAKQTRALRGKQVARHF
jgi:hypothetical protein